METRRFYSENNAVSHTTTNSFKPVVQKKLAVGASNDSYEVEADTVADKVMRMNMSGESKISSGQPNIQRKCTACEEEEKVRRKPIAENITPLIQRHGLTSAEGGVASSQVESKINSSRGGGSLMDGATQNFMESRFGTDFSGVRIHTGSEAIQMSRELNAQAFTVGNDIYFNQGKYSPNTDTGKHLLAHELTHTIQQSGNVERKIQKMEMDGFCIKSFFGGEVLFDGLGANDLRNIAIINEDDGAGTITPVVNGRWYACDGFWVNGMTQWFKIPDHCKVEVFDSPRLRTGFFSSCCNLLASIFKDGPHWSNDGLDDSKQNPF